jgi:hypothetical protein
LKNGLLIVVLSVVVVLATLLIPTAVLSPEATAAIGYGLPFAYIVQDQSRIPFGVDGAPALPRWQGVGSPWEYPVQLQPLYLLLDIIIVAVLLGLARLWLRRLT